MRIVVIGAGGAIGAALLSHYRDVLPDSWILGCARRPLPAASGATQWAPLDLLDEPSIAAAAGLASAAGPLDRVLVCSGLLHMPGRRPEKSLQQLDPDWLQQNFAVNASGPALAMKHFLPLLRRDRRAVCMALSARVGSISDNRSGGWYGYRAAKAALNMLVACTAIELRRTHPHGLVFTLHPGTVDSPLSAPFQGRLPPGQLQSPVDAAAQLFAVIESASPDCSGRCLAWDGSVIPP